MDNTITLAVIGGTGVYQLSALESVTGHDIQTQYGAPSAPIYTGYINGKKIAFLARHGKHHAIAPHKINYRANLAALQQLGAQRILALNTVGGITSAFAPQVLACPDQIIDYTWGRISTLCEEPGTEVLHIDFSQPYTPHLRAKILAAAETSAIKVHNGGCYGATQGPRLESCAEIARLRRDGCDLVGMTGMPEAALARELGLEYACLAIVANWAAGCGNNPTDITLAEVLENVQTASAVLPLLLLSLLKMID